MCASALCDRVPDLQSGGCSFESRPGLLRTRSTQPSIPPGLVNEYQLRLGRQRQVWLIPNCGRTCGCAVKLWNPLRTRAIPERFCGGDSLRRGAISSVCTFYLYLYVNKSQNFRTSYMHARSMRNKYDILHDDQTRCEEHFYMLATSADAWSVCSS